MAADDLSESESLENDSNSSYEGLESQRNGGKRGMSEYEKQRMKRIEENRVRMEALGLPKMASFLMGSVQKNKRNKDPRGKRKMVEEDEEYKPPVGEEALSSSSDEDSEKSEDGESSRTRSGKAKKRNSHPTKKVQVQTQLGNSDNITDDDALMQAIALSLKDCAGFLDVGNGGSTRSSDNHAIDGSLSKRKGNTCTREDLRKRKKKKSFASRVQMTEDELVLHFFQFDEAGKGSITLRDLRRVAAAHDFIWTDKEMADMIYCFDSDGDGKLSLEDFQNIVSRCNMIQGADNAAIGSKS